MKNKEIATLYRTNICLFFLALSNSTIANTYYVDLHNVTPLKPYTSRNTAATNIQDAVDQTKAADTVLIADGTYLLNREITVAANVLIKSMYGPQHVIVDGQNKIRCFNLKGTNCILSGLTITHGYVTEYNTGGGISCADVSSVITNCVVVENHATLGGGINLGQAQCCLIVSNTAYWGGGTRSTITQNCQIMKNVALSGGDYGGGMNGGIASNCLISGNTAFYGGGVYGTTTYNCKIVNNTGGSNGGGMYEGKAYNCTISSNTVTFYGGGLSDSTAHNCVILYNRSTSNYGGGMMRGTAYNCTIIGNTSRLAGGGAYSGNIYNSIITENKSELTAYNNFNGSSISYSCSPDLSDKTDGNITNAPVFADMSSGDYHLRAESPCINSGDTNKVSTLVDLDKNPRIMAGIVDMGAYEYFADQSDYDGDGLLNGWEMKYFGSITCATANEDPDGDGQNNISEQTTGRDPLDAASFFAITTYSRSNNNNGLTITWPSATNRLYSILWSTNLTAGFLLLTNDITYPQSSYTTVMPLNTNLSFFYRVGVRLAD